MMVAVGMAVILASCSDQSSEPTMEDATKTDVVKGDQPEKKRSSVIVGNGQKYDPGSIVSGINQKRNEQ